MFGYLKGLILNIRSLSLRRTALGLKIKLYLYRDQITLKECGSTANNLSVLSETTSRAVQTKDF